MMKTIPTLRSLTLIAAACVLIACTSVQIDTAPTDRFSEGNYRSYSWWGAAVENTAGSHDPLYVVDPSLRAAVDRVLASKGYRYVETGGDFLIDYQFKASLSEGAVDSTALKADNRYPIPNNTTINRRADQALIDNAYALGGPREMNSILLRFSEKGTKSLVWAASMSKIVEDVNHDDSSKMVKGINTAVERALRRLPDAT